MAGQPDFLPISHLNALEYCPRRFYYEFVLGEMVVNEHVLEGRLRHERVDEAERERVGEQVTLRRVYLYSERLRLVGFADVIEETDGKLRPVEYKKGRWGRWLRDEIQLCAQALCLEEQTGQPVDYGFLFYFGSRRRKRVEFTPDLRERTLATVKRAFALVDAGRLPPPIDHPARCRDCSLEPMCLPREVLQLLRAG